MISLGRDLEIKAQVGLVKASYAVLSRTQSLKLIFFPQQALMNVKPL